MKYPAIYKSVEGSEYLYQNKDSYYCYERQVWDSSESHHDCHHSDTNITAEYLANTFGEVKSKEHAEFIVKLADVNGFRLCNPEKTNKKWFCFDDNELYLFDDVEDASDLDEKHITIPLPPKEYLMEFEEREDEASKDDWPKVGSKALVNNDNDYELSYGEELIGKEVEVINLFTDGDLEMAVVKRDVANYCFRIEMLSKPKTPEQELRDEIASLLDSYVDSEKTRGYFVNKILELTKKPQ